MITLWSRHFPKYGPNPFLVLKQRLAFVTNMDTLTLFLVAGCSELWSIWNLWPVAGWLVEALHFQAHHLSGVRVKGVIELCPLGSDLTNSSKGTGIPNKGSSSSV